MLVEALAMLVACPSCSKAMRLEGPEQVGDSDRFACPHCKHEFGMSDLPVATRVARSAPARHAPPPPSLPRPSNLPASGDAEVDILTLYPSLLCARPFLWLGLGAGSLAGLTIGVVVLATQSAPRGVGIALVIAGLCAGGLLAVWRRLLSGSQIRVTNKRLIDRDGVVHRHVSEVLHKDVKNIRVEQTIWQRLCDAGSVAIYTSGSHEPEVFMDNVPSPHKVREIIDTYRPL